MNTTFSIKLSKNKIIENKLEFWNPDANMIQGAEVVLAPPLLHSYEVGDANTISTPRRLFRDFHKTVLKLN